VISPDLADVPALALDDDGEAIGIRVTDARHPGGDFAKSRLVDVELVRCDLSGCDFSESVWQRVRLVDCRGSSIDLSQAQLRDVTFDGCRLDEANLRMARLHRVRFEGSQLAGAELTAGTLEGVSFPASDLASADFSQSRCVSVDLRSARLGGLRGVGSLSGSKIGFDQLVGLAPALALALGLKIEADDPPDDR
jgi:uncharacterized protein YjbI with pentapeptide repeats